MDITQHVKTIKTDMEKDLMLPQSDSGFHKISAILKNDPSRLPGKLIFGMQA